MIVRDFQAVIGREARQQCLDAVGQLPDEVIACVGGGSNSAGMFYPFIEDDGVALERVVLVAPESDVLMIVAHAGLEQAVDRLRAPAGQLAHTLGGARR
ncbi:hypothetical protein M2T53_28780, partial [Klebsiella pneumoniae]|nr:hypothetical protein [Klebsiella pneumoniae]